MCCLNQAAFNKFIDYLFSPLNAPGVYLKIGSFYPAFFRCRRLIRVGRLIEKIQYIVVQSDAIRDSLLSTHRLGGGRGGGGERERRGWRGGGRGGRENVWLEDVTLGSYLSFTISGFSFNSFQQTIL